MVSFWKRLFGKGCKAGASPVSSLSQKYLDKYQKFIFIMTESETARDILDHLRLQMEERKDLDFSQVQKQSADLLQHLRQALDLLQQFCQKKPEALTSAFEDLAARINQVLEQANAPADLAGILATLQPLLFSTQPGGPLAESIPTAACSCLQEVMDALTEQRLQEMFCLSLRSQVTKKQAASLVTGRLVPILVIDVGGGLSSPGPTVGLDDIASIPYKAFLSGMLSIPWPKARPVDMKGFISVVGVTSTTPRAEDQLQKVSVAILAREYMNFSLCLGYHASTIEAYVGRPATCNYLRFHYEGGAASVERRVRRLRLIQGILTRLGFEVDITGDLLDGRKTGEDAASCLKLLEILGRLEVFTKQMDMVMTDDEVIYGYIDDFMAKHC
jgi:DNA-directed RNA polymerase subunit F